MDNEISICADEILKRTNRFHDSFIIEIKIAFRQFSFDCGPDYPFDVQDVTVMFQLPKLIDPDYSIKKVKVVLENAVSVNIDDLSKFEWLIEEVFITKKANAVVFEIDKRMSVSADGIYIFIM